MSSTNTYTEQKYCVYHTTYFGDKLPPNYIGSSTVENIRQGYKGSVKSKKYKEIWENELKINPHLFSIEIISYHETKPAALYKELQIQQLFNVVKNPLFVNMAYAIPNGYFGMDVSGKNNPMFGKNRSGKNNPMFGKTGENNPNIGLKWNANQIQKVSGENNHQYGKIGVLSKNYGKKYKRSNDTKLKISNVAKNRPMFLCLLHNKKEYTKQHIAIHFKELKQFF